MTRLIVAGLLLALLHAIVTLTRHPKVDIPSYGETKGSWRIPSYKIPEPGIDI